LAFQIPCLIDGSHATLSDGAKNSIPFMQQGMAVQPSRLCTPLPALANGGPPLYSGFWSVIYQRPQHMLPILRSTLSEHDELRPIKHLYISIAYDHEDLLLIRTYFEAQDH